METLLRPTITALSRYCPIPVVIEPQSIHTFRSGFVGRCGAALRGCTTSTGARPVVSNLNSRSADLIQEARYQFSYTVEERNINASVVDVMVLSLGGVYIPF